MQSKNWTDQSRNNQNGAANTATGKSRHNSIKPYNKVEKALNKMLAQPVEISKGRSLLEKMGWKGGGLGKDGEGIVEPIQPKATYATRTIGLGLPTEINETESKGKRRYNCEWKEQKKQKKQKITKEKPKVTKIKIPKQPKKKKEDPNFVFTEEDIEFKMNFRQNVLLKILDLVKDDAQTEVVFQEQLTREERKDIHDMVENMRLYKETFRFFFEDATECEIVEDILAHNHYYLYSKSKGQGTQRRLTVYKRAPDDIFLITPEDLRKNPISHNDVSILEHAKDNEEELKTKSDVKAVDVDEDGGAKSEENITAFDEDVECMSFDTAAEEDKDDDDAVDRESEVNCKRDFEDDDGVGDINVNDSNHIKDKIMSRLIIFLKKFVDEITFKELRFLGSFNEEEFAVIQLFFDVCSGTVFDEKYSIWEVLKHDVYNFVVGVDNNETFVVYRTMKDPTSYQ